MFNSSTALRRLCVLVAGFTLAALGVLVPAAHATTPSTVVSLTFDDGSSSQYSTLPMLQLRGMTGTYYVNSALVGSSGYYMTWPQIHDLANAGNEIGGHTLHHTNLTKVSAATATTEVCDDRTNLLNQGFSPMASFAYPEAAVNATAEQVVASCGYGTGRGVGNLFGPGCPCSYAETVPPRDAFNLRTAEPAVSTTTLADLQTSVTNAETHGGGWVPIVFHGICDNSCTSTNSLSPSIFTAFLDWLGARSASGTVVRTVGQAMTGSSTSTTPTTTIACNNATCSNGWYATSPVTVTLSPTPPIGQTIASTVYTTDGSEPTSTSTYSGPFQLAQTTTVKFYSTDSAGHVESTKTQLIQIDTAAPTVSLTSPSNGATYKWGTKVSFAADAGDTISGVASVRFYVDGILLTTDSAAPYVTTWNTRRFALGQHVLTAQATDIAQNTTTSTAVTVTIFK